MKFSHTAKIIYFLFICMATSLLFSSFKLVSSSVPPAGFTGATGSTCSACHTPPAGAPNPGFVSMPSIPGAYIPGDSYDFSVLISSSPSANRWGFSLKAVDAGGNPIGTFSTTNGNVSVSDNEIHHNNAVTNPSGSYTYTGLKWQAPATPSGPVTFYVAAVAADGIGGNSDDFVYSSSSTATALPIELIRFQGKNEQKYNYLTWQTASESNNSHFVIERSENGDEYEEVGRINGKGTSSAQHDYSFLDKNLLKKIYYYRLKQVDFDGRNTTSKAIVVKNQSPIDFKVFPNPTKDQLQISLSADETISSVELIDLQGRTILTTDKNIISLRNQVKGNYVVKVTNNEGQFFSKMITLE